MPLGDHMREFGDADCGRTLLGWEMSPERHVAPCSPPTSIEIVVRQVDLIDTCK